MDVKMNSGSIFSRLRRTNLFLDVFRKSGNDENDLKSFMVPKTHKVRGQQKYEFDGPCIIYCPSRKVSLRRGLLAVLLKLIYSEW